jgi:hypothetical protein
MTPDGSMSPSSTASVGCSVSAAGSASSGRSGSNVLRRFAGLALRVGAELHARDAILDGEVVALDDERRMDFRALLAGKGWWHYAAFDLLWLNGKDLRAHPLIKRKRRLEQLIPTNNPTFSRVLAWMNTGASSMKPPSGWTLRALWLSGRGTPTDRLVQSEESRLHPSRGARGPVP